MNITTVDVAIINPKRRYMRPESCGLSGALRQSVPRSMWDIGELHLTGSGIAAVDPPCRMNCGGSMWTLRGVVAIGGQGPVPPVVVNHRVPQHRLLIGPRQESRPERSQ